MGGRERKQSFCISQCSHISNVFVSYTLKQGSKSASRPVCQFPIDSTTSSQGSGPPYAAQPSVSGQVLPLRRHCSPPSWASWACAFVTLCSSCSRAHHCIQQLLSDHGLASGTDSMLDNGPVFPDCSLASPISADCFQFLPLILL